MNDGHVAAQEPLGESPRWGLSNGAFESAREDNTMPGDWLKRKFIVQKHKDKGLLAAAAPDTEKLKPKCVHVDKLMAKMEQGKKQAWVVDIEWLQDELAKFSQSPLKPETIRFAVDKDGEFYIETYKATAAEIEGCPPNWEGDPPGWNNDWPEIDLP